MRLKMVVRIVVVGLMSVAALGATAARGQIAPPDKHAPRIVVHDSTNNNRDVAPHGMTTKTEGGTTVSRMNITGQQTVTRECTTEAGAETKLGLLGGTAVYGHCGTI